MGNHWSLKGPKKSKSNGSPSLPFHANQQFPYKLVRTAIFLKSQILSKKKKKFKKSNKSHKKI
jgi:hypothetical protein